MTRIPPFHMHWLPALGVALVFSAMASRGQSQEPSPGQRQFAGAAACAQCHYAGLPESDLEGALSNVRLVEDSWVKRDEAKKWANDDQHAQSYAILLKERAQQMGVLLRVTEIHRDKRCLACHSALPLDHMAPGQLADERFTHDTRLTLGVSCEGCHGRSGDSPDGSLKGWYTAHIAKDENISKGPWRYMADSKKESDFGFVNVRSPLSKARMCASCHVGNVAEGKIVTHEMYAAGHPPLPGFELETFARQMPQHWVDLADKPAAMRDDYLAKTNQTLNDDSLPKTKSLMVASLVTLAESLKLSADLCNEEVQSPVGKPFWPELAQFECFACHHELKSPSWRQDKKGPPGIAVLRQWPEALVRVSVLAAGVQQSELNEQLKTVQDVIDAQPFGSREDVQINARGVSQWANNLAEQLEVRRLTRDEANQILKNICRVCSSEILEYDSARQMVWAFRVVDGELNQRPNDDEVKLALDKVESMFLLELNPRIDENQRQTAERVPTSFVKLPGESRPRSVVVVELENVLPPVNKYDAGKFQEQFKEIAELVDQLP